MSIHNFLADELNDHVLRGEAYTVPPSVEIALYSDPQDAADGGTELTGFGYARQTVTFDVSAGRATANSNLVTFTAAGGNWLTATHFSLRDGTSGDPLYFGTLTSPIQLNDTESADVAIGALTHSST